MYLTDYRKINKVLEFLNEFTIVNPDFAKNYNLFDFSKAYIPNKSRMNLDLLYSVVEYHEKDFVYTPRIMTVEDWVYIKRIGRLKDYVNQRAENNFYTEFTETGWKLKHINLDTSIVKNELNMIIENSINSNLVLDIISLESVGLKISLYFVIIMICDFLLNHNHSNQTII